MPPESFSQGIQQFNQRQYYECHDTLEAIWIEAPEMDQRFYQGILQVAVACHHLSNLNLRGAIILLGEGIRRLSDYQPDYYTIDVNQLLEESVTLLQTLQQLDSDRVDDFVQQLFSATEKLDKSGESCKLPTLVII
ncbi:conserved hypothetical protein [Hyella patelloides LEGE 07179]|uniref:DUF309 domain-containing protein n=1 Tax=Hyella patelloides LEGE 07179 TaxID=945734 RepID=A0A563VMC7_9CYAN|nr:DUF309 domain-containing protein [Hyella patelloides]VEP12568.1 conserved hypothetical protein [Hyella patelloides LEGE 07179]